ncbi:MAG: tetratricopeptide repeat protein [Dehalococcoidia bacterium]
MARFRAGRVASRLTQRAFLVYGLLVLIAAGAAVLRTWDIANNPPGFFTDEASLGYNAYSILHTGRDEHGELMPLFFRAFGEYKLAFEVYAVVPSIALLGMTELAVRLPSVVLGVLAVIALFLFVRELTRDDVAALLSAGVLAILPWHIHYNRTGFDNISGHVLFLVLGLYFFVLGVRRPWFWLASSAAFALSLYTYRSAWALLPALLLLVAVVYRQELLKHWRVAAVSLLLLGLAGIPILQHTLAATGDRTQDQWIFALDLGAWDTVTRFAAQYRDHFENAFLFDGRAERNLRHVLPGQGWIYTWQIPFLVIGAASLLWRPKKASWLILGCLAIFPLAAALSVSGPSSNRALFGAAVFSVLTALGLASTLHLVRGVAQRFGGRALGVGLAGVVLVGTMIWASFQLASYLDAYHGRYQEVAAEFNGWQWGAGDVIDAFVSVEDEYDELYLGGEFNAPQIFFSFYAPDACGNCTLGTWDRYDPGRRQLFALSPRYFAQAYEYDVKQLLYDPGANLAFVIAEIIGTRQHAPGLAPNLNVGSPTRSLAELDRAIEADRTAEVFAERGLLHLNEGRYEPAIQDLSRAITLDGSLASAYVNRGNALWSRDEFAGAIADYTSAIELDPGLFPGLYNRGNAYATFGDGGRAVRDYGEALKLEPNHARGRNNLAAVFMQRGDFQRALDESELALQRDPGMALAYANRGEARWRLTATTEQVFAVGQALDDFDRAIELDPALALAYARRGEVVLVANAAPARAIADFSQAIELEPESAAGYSGRGFAYVVMGDHAQAAADLDRAKDLDRDDASALLRRAVAYLRLGDVDVAIRDLRQAVRLDQGFEATAPEWRVPAWSIAGRALELQELEGASLDASQDARDRLRPLLRYLRSRT